MRIFNAKRILVFIYFFLGGLFILSFFDFSAQEKKVKTALLNKKYNNLVTEISLFTNDSSKLLIKKYDNLWVSSNENGIAFPITQNLVQQFILDTSNPYDMNIISQKSQQIQSLNLIDENTADFSIIFSGKDSDIFSKIYFNRKESELGKLILRPDSSIKIYKMSNFLEQYFHTDADFWCDPYLVPKFFDSKKMSESIQNIVLLQTTNNQSLKKNLSRDLFNDFLALRHGNVMNESAKLSLENPETVISLEFGNASKISLYFYKNLNQQDYLIKYYFYPGFDVSSFEKQGIELLNYQVHLSNWTYNKIINLFVE